MALLSFFCCPKWTGKEAFNSGRKRTHQERRTLSGDDRGLYGFWVDYAPTNANLAFASMSTLLTAVETTMDNVQTSLVPWKNKVADPENIYGGVRPRATQILGGSQHLVFWLHFFQPTIHVPEETRHDG
jgi:hypothetical protein